jgi:hypothetical protein
MASVPAGMPLKLTHPTLMLAQSPCWSGHALVEATARRRRRDTAGIGLNGDPPAIARATDIMVLANVDGHVTT